MNSTSLPSLYRLALAASLLASGLYMAAPQNAYAFGFVCTNCATLSEQMHQYAEEVNTQLNTAKQLQTQIQQYKDMVKQGLALPSRMFNSVTSDLRSVVATYNNAQSLGRDLSNLESRFKEQFPGYDAYLKETGQAAQMMPDRYKKWALEGLDNARTAMQAAKINTSTFASEDAQLDKILNRSQQASGRLQAIQAGNEIAASNVQQLQKLRDLVTTQIYMQGNYMAQMQERASTDDALRQQRRGGVIINTGRDKGY
ncbi:P-type conjugative transfer protein TrbJ [Xenorhabdus eapokensis]|uniref:P-type conjugative transfer protein TrbJ n=1 Tax=Xenorhabdus eapokensis TaxID=1873482 RepID=A0A1Q5TKQ7_9GAMM|nr:P-type conjugative transfer protein TrbJ [Xenorhabdus eapokensis]OKP00813.1 P-type conjugative transfer protein TrbJ [Xenorhabdus eapokensis]